MINAEKGGCGTCVHSPVCKYKGDFTDLQERASKIRVTINSANFELSARCKHYGGLLPKYGAERSMS